MGVTATQMSLMSLEARRMTLEQLKDEPWIAPASRKAPRSLATKSQPIMRLRCVLAEGPRKEPPKQTCTSMPTGSEDEPCIAPKVSRGSHRRSTYTGTYPVTYTVTYTVTSAEGARRAASRRPPPS